MLTRREFKKGIQILCTEGPQSLLDSVNRYYVKPVIFTSISNWYIKKNRNSILSTEELLRDVAEDYYKYTERESESIELTENTPPSVEPYCDEVQYDPQYAVKIGDGILHESSIELAPNGDLIYDSIGKSRRILRNKLRTILFQNITRLIKLLSASSFHGVIPRPQRTIKSGFPLVRSGSYYHWVVDFLPKLRAYNMIDDKMTGTIPIIIEPDPPSWVIEYLDIFGYHDNQILEIPSECVRINEMVTVPRRMQPTTASNNPEKWFNAVPSSDLDWVRNICKQNVETTDKGNNNRIYISREESAGGRKISNRKEFVNLLDGYGFNKYTLGELSVRDQIRLFSNAEVVIGVHGAGLTNIVYAEDSTVVEIFREEQIKHYYYCLSKQMGHDYEYFTGANNNSNIYVDVSKFSKILEDLIENRSSVV